MKREIKFRVWDHNTDTMMIPDDFEFCDGEISWIDAGREAGPKSGNDGDPGQFEIMQYTGLHDKNGREIYEGDVVRTGKDNIGDPEPMIGQVIMREGSWIIENEKKQEAIDLFSEITSREVIGNIFEDKQLLEGKQ
ncbi:YopX family protein [Lacticaseibacillus paracasei]|uniref:YopX family protein n=1 Tax=Lacticaseibacillus paracasei TaxID=1597 RepID=UPI0025A0957D|nr:YopX family protein [Lacticaseibacillus paracasei]MDM7527177.1 YopX family protein [Lacticaseibacillus paracasei]